MNAKIYTKDYDGNRDPRAEPRLIAVNFVAGNGDKMRVPVELLRQLIAELDEEGGWLRRTASGEEKGANDTAQLRATNDATSTEDATGALAAAPCSASR